MSANFQRTQNGEAIILPPVGSWPGAWHVWEEDPLWAVKAALEARRPLLVRGEPGTGKSQLARAAAALYRRAFVPAVVHARTECQDLMYRFDAVGRLGKAQEMAVPGACGDGSELAPEKFLTPGPLWWAFDWRFAEEQAEKAGGVKLERPDGWQPQQGCVLLIDEIDKADADLPNGLLETLGNGNFPVPYLGVPVRMHPDIPPPLVVITTNEERELPAAFLRRCLVLHLSLPKERQDLKRHLVGRGRVHFRNTFSKEVLKEAARQLLKDRSAAKKRGLPAPGQAEYLDILRALKALAGNQENEQLEILKKIQKFALEKNPADAP